MSITDFLLARIAEDELEAFYIIHDDGVYFVELHSRVLAECEAKRRIVEKVGAMLLTDRWEYDLGRASLASDVLDLLALPYADHADYDEAWRP